MKNKKILVTGGSGFIGSHLIDALKKENPKQIVNFDIETGHNLLDFNATLDFFKMIKPDIVFNLAVLPLPASLTTPYIVTKDIVSMMLNILELSRQRLYKRLVHISSSEAYGSAVYTPQDEKHPLNPHTPYASAKVACDLIALSYTKTFGLDIVIPRCFNTYGPRQPVKWGALMPKCISNVLQNKPPLIFKGGQRTRDFIYVEDAVAGIIGVAKYAQTGDIVNIGTSMETSVMSVLEKICKLMNYKGKIDYQEQRPADVSQLCADITKSREMFGFNPRINLDEGLKRMIDYYVKNKIP